MLDIKTLLATYILNCLINAIVLGYFWTQNKSLYRGIAYWMDSLILQTAGIFLVILRGSIPDFFSVWLANVLLALAALMVFEGYRRFLEEKSRYIHNFVFLVLFALASAWHTFYQPDVSRRVIVLSAFVMVLFLQSGWMQLVRASAKFRNLTRFSGLVSLFYAIVQGYRIAVELIAPNGINPFVANTYASFGQLINQFLTTVMVFSFIIMLSDLNLHNRIIAQEELQKSHEQTHDLYHNAPCGYHSSDAEGMIQSMNKTELDWLGYKAEEVIGKMNILSIATPESVQVYRKHLPKDKSGYWLHDLRMEFLRKDGAVLPIIVNSKPVFDQQGNYLYNLTTNFNRTEIDRVEEELQASREKADKANRAKDDFLSNMSHELRTPLNSILVLSGVMGKDPKAQLTLEHRKYLEIIQRNGKALLDMINDILDLSRAEAGKTEVTIRKFRLGDVISSVIDMMQPVAREKNIELRWELEPGFSVKIQSDQDKVSHILQNMIDNAVKFTDAGFVEVSVAYRNNTVAVAVSDTGTGIREEHLEQIFDAFRQADSSLTKRYGGTGLGLAIAKKYAELLGGTITVRSTAGKGSVFTMEIPLDSSPAAPIAAYL